MASVRERIERLSIPEPNSGCWLWLGSVNRLGYGKFMHERRQIKAHRASWEAHHGKIPDRAMVLHTCDVRCCVNPSHLFIGDQSANMHDMWRKNRHSGGGAKGARNKFAKLSENDVLAIRRSTISIAEVVRIFDVSRSYAYAIRAGKTWRHI